MDRSFPSTARSARALFKAASDPVLDPAYQAKVKHDALAKLLLSAGLGLGVGVGGRALVGGLREITRPTVNPFMHSSPVSTPLPVYGDDEDDTPPPVPGRRKLASETAAPAGPGIFQTVANQLPDITTNDPSAQGWLMPAHVAAFGGPMFGGWALTDWLLKHRHAGDVQHDVDDAASEFERAMAREYRTAMHGKTADDKIHPLTQAIDAFYDACDAAAQAPGAVERVKSAAGISDMLDIPWLPWNAVVGKDTVSRARGLIGTAALLAATGAGTLAYKYTKSQSPEEALRKAIRMRARNRAAAPVPPYAVLANPGG